METKQKKTVDTTLPFHLRWTLLTCWLERQSMEDSTVKTCPSFRITSVSPPFSPLLTNSDSDNIDGGFSVLKVCSSVYSPGLPSPNQTGPVPVQHRHIKTEAERHTSYPSECAFMGGPGPRSLLLQMWRPVVFRAFLAFFSFLLQERLGQRDPLVQILHLHLVI